MHAPLPLFDTDAVRRLEALGIAAAGGDPFALMARAGSAAWRSVLAHWPHARRIVVACGPGNNGGDGYELARHALEAGRDVRVVREQPPSSPLAQRACDAYVAAGGTVGESNEVLDDADLIVDALFGIGLPRAPEGDARALIEAINANAAPVLALEVPSGIDASRGSAPGVAIVADRTLQLLARHRGLRTGVAVDHVGALDFDGLDIDPALADGVDVSAFAYRADLLPTFFPLRPRDSHKGRHGHVLCIGGGEGSGGAVVLAAEAALRTGAGLASLATRASDVAAILARRPELMPHAIADADQLAPLLARADVVALGPGLGRDERARALLDAVLAIDVPRVFDADALTLLSGSGGALSARDVITPHPGEAARMLGVATSDVQRDRFGAACALCERYGAQVVLKGAGSIVASPGAPPAVVCAGNPGMATGGMGDLLTGVVAALLAQGFEARDAAIAGALLHAGAGDAAARDDGERGLLPSDLLPWLRRLANPARR